MTLINNKSLNGEKMTQLELETIKQTQLRIVDVIHQLCVENRIKYYIIGGTLIGAVRHKGFIPWDVDIDIAMPRADYEKFKLLATKNLGETYRYYDYTVSKNYWRPHAIVFDSRTKVFLKHDLINGCKEQTGVYIDIFPLDNAPDDEKLREKQAKRLLRLRKFKAYRLPYSYSQKKYVVFAHHCLSVMLSLFISVRAINKWQQKEMCRYNDKQTSYLCSMASKYAYKKQCMPREIYGTPVLLPFEGREYYAPEKYAEYLNRIFGNYMELPPIEMRQSNLEIYSKVEYLSE